MASFVRRATFDKDRAGPWVEADILEGSTIGVSVSSGLVWDTDVSQHNRRNTETKNSDLKQMQMMFIRAWRVAPDFIFATLVFRFSFTEWGYQCC